MTVLAAPRLAAALVLGATCMTVAQPADARRPQWMLTPVPSPAPAQGGCAATPVLLPIASASEVEMSDERRCSRWAEVDVATRARTSPAPSAPTKMLLRRWTEDQAPEVVLLLSRRAGADGHPWFRVRLPMRPANQTGWVRADRLDTPRVVTTLLRVDRARRRATLYRDGRAIWAASVGVGKASTPTPAGHFYVRERLRPDDPRGTYGPVAFGTSAYAPTLSEWPGGGIVGLHGTDQPLLIPGAVSHGCVRVRNARIRRLARLLPIGTPLRVV